MTESVPDMSMALSAILKFCPPDVRSDFSVATRNTIIEIIVALLVSPVSDTERMRGQLESMLLVYESVEPGHDVIRDTVRDIINTPGE